MQQASKTETLSNQTTQKCECFDRKASTVFDRSVDAILEEVSVARTIVLCLTVKGTTSDSMGIGKIFKPLRNKKNTYQSQHVPFFLKNPINLTEKQLFLRFHWRGP